MATTFKSFLEDDIVTSRALLHENIPITGSIVRGNIYSNQNIKSYTHGMFQSVYDYPFTSSAANQLFDMSVGVSTDVSNYTNFTESNKKVNMYNQVAQVLNGYGSDGTILSFDKDGDQASSGIDQKYGSIFILNFNRLITKDEVKRGTFEVTLGIGTSSLNPFERTCTVSDLSASTNWKSNSPTGEYGILYSSNFVGTSPANTNREVGLIYYQAGIAVISTSIFAQSASNSPLVELSGNVLGQLSYVPTMNDSSFSNVATLFASGSVNDANSCLRNRVKNIRLNNTTELNSTIHFCRVGHRDFNYSSNPTYLEDSQIVVKSKAADAPITYITTVGLYSPDNELLAVAKLSEPIKKDPSQELILRVRLDY